MESIKQLLQRDDPTVWVFAGDSITHGARHTIGWRDYVELFTERVRFEMGRYRDFIIKSGISGWNIKAISNDLDWNVLQFHPHCVSLMVGLNDCREGAEGVAEFRDTYLRVIERIRRASGAEVLLHTPNGILITDGVMRTQNLPAYVEAIREVATNAEVPLIDHYTEWNEAQSANNDAMHHWIGHGCHPNQYGHRAMAFALFRALDIWDPASWTCQLNVPR